MEIFEEIKESKGRKFLFFVEKSPDKKDYDKYEYLRMEVWGDPEDYLPCSRNMSAENYFNYGSNLFIGIYSEDDKGRIRRDRGHFVGFAYGYIGVIDKNIGYQKIGNLNFYSQYAAVRKDYQNFNLGLMLKKFQRKIIWDVLHIDSMTSTFDPLTGINAYRNIHKLGMEVLEYKESFYKDFSGALNREDIPSDRFFVLWKLGEKNKQLDYDFDSLLERGSLVISSHLEKIRGKHNEVFIEVSHEPDFTGVRSLKQYLLTEIPYDFYRMIHETDGSDEKARNIPLDWRMRTREAFKELFKVGYKIIDFRSYKDRNRIRNFYIWEK